MTNVFLGVPGHAPSAEYSYPKVLLLEPEHPDSAALIAVWNQHAASGGMRVGRDIPSRALSKFLSHIIIAEPNADISDANIRLAGSSMIERFGRDISGLNLSELYVLDPKGSETLLAAAREALASQTPRIVGTRVMWGAIEAMRVESVLLPILSRNGTSQWVMIGTFFFRSATEVR